MLHLVLRCVLAAVLLAAALAKAARPRESRRALDALAGTRSPAAGWAALIVLVGLETALAAGVAAGLDAAAVAAAVLMAAFAGVLALALRRGRAGAPCGCFGARSTVGRPAVARATLLSAGFAALPFVPRVDPGAEAWLAAGLGIALAGVAGLAVALLALAREVGALRLALGPQRALDIPGEGPPVGSDSGLAAHFAPGGPPLALAVFTSPGCALCEALAPSLASLARNPHVTMTVLDEERDAEAWRRLAIPGSPYALALDRDGTVLARGTFNTLAQLESVLAAGERRLQERTGEAVVA